MTRWPRNLHIRPLDTWPTAPTRDRTTSPFRASWAATIDLLDCELDHISTGATALQVAITEVDLRNDGMIRAGARTAHPGVILSTTTRTGALSFPCDRFTTWQDNTRAIALALEALRKVDRYGITRRGEQYTGWKALGSADAVHEESPLAVIAQLSAELPGHFDFDRDMARYRDDPAEIARDFRTARGLVHPDRRGGDRTAWDRLERAAKALGLIT